MAHQACRSRLLNILRYQYSGKQPTLYIMSDKCMSSVSPLSLTASGISVDQVQESFSLHGFHIISLYVPNKLLWG